jgi:hypothetical protein
MSEIEGFNQVLLDSQAITVQPLNPDNFDWYEYFQHSQEINERYASFLGMPSGIAVWQRVRAAEVFRDGCSDMHFSLGLQTGALKKSMEYLSDSPSYLEPWLGIGTTAAFFGATYKWLHGQAPAVLPKWNSLQAVPRVLKMTSADRSIILTQTLEMISYFLEKSRGLAPISWCDIQCPLNVAAELMDTQTLLTGLIDDPERIRDILSVISEQIISFTHMQTELIGSALVRPGHGFASSFCGKGIGLSSDNALMISPRMWEKYCNADMERIGSQFGGTAFHSCGNWERWIDSVKKIPGLTMVDAAFSPMTDPNPNGCEPFKEKFAHTGVIVQARMVGSAGTVLNYAKRLWSPGMKLIVVTYVEDPIIQHKLYHDIHQICS